MSCAESAPEMVVPPSPCGGALTWTVPTSSSFLVSRLRTPCARQGREHVEERGACGVEAKLIEDEVGAGKESGGAEKEGGGGDVAGNGGFDGVQLLSAGDGDGISDAVDGGSEGTKSQFAVVASPNGFADGRGSVRLKSGDRTAGFDLCAGDGRGVVDRREGRAVDGHGCCRR